MTGTRSLCILGRYPRQMRSGHFEGGCKLNGIYGKKWKKWKKMEKNGKKSKKWKKWKKMEKFRKNGKI